MSESTGANIKGWYWVFPRGDRRDLTSEILPVALFQIKSHAIEFARRWPETAEIILMPGHEVVMPLDFDIGDEVEHAHHGRGAVSGLVATCRTIGNRTSYEAYYIVQFLDESRKCAPGDISLVVE